MGAWGHYSIGEQIIAEYNLASHGDAGATYEKSMNADLPSYAHGFYSPTQQEQFADVKYQKTEIGYDKDAREIQEAIRGPPLEAYIPRVILEDGPVSSAPKTGRQDVGEAIVVKDPPQDIIREILRAQQDVMAKEINIEELEVEEIIIKRKMKKRKVSLRFN